MRSRVIAALAVAGLLVGTTAASAGSMGVPVPAALAFHTVDPVRVLDTRIGVGVTAVPMSVGSVVVVSVPGLPEDATAIAINLTAVGGTGPSYLTLYANGDPVPATSALNRVNKGAVANGTVVRLSLDHKFNIRNSSGTVDVIVDLIGYYSPAPEGPAGPVGETGATGATGPAGLDGAVGPAGATGETGPAGATGDIGPAGATGAIGPAGATGAIGPAGATGAVGAVGAAGAKGDAGAPGDIGPAGATGETGPAGPAGATGRAGTAGAVGPAGAKGDNGATGATGPAGPAGGGGGGAILAASSGGAVAVTTTGDGGSGNVAVLPLSGTLSQTTTLTGSSLDTTRVGNTVQVFPRAGTVTSISARFSVTQALSLVGSTVSLKGQLYTSSADDNTLTPVAGATCTLAPPLTGVIAVGNLSDCTATGLSIPVTNQTSAVLVMSATAAGLSLTNTITGYVSLSLAVS